MKYVNSGLCCEMFALNICKGINYQSNIFDFLKKIDKDFKPNLSNKVDLEEWAQKMAMFGRLFFHVDCRNNEWVSLSVCYDDSKTVYWTFFGVLKEYRQCGLGIQLEKKIIDYYKSQKKETIEGEVRQSNKKIITFHKMFGFNIETTEKFDLDEKKLKICLKL